jgi:hypothetical protein
MCTDRHAGERGVALALVLAVLICLLAVAIPFSLSMRHEQGGASFRSFDDEARRTATSVRDLAIARLGDTAPDRDPTPWADDAAETSSDVEAQAKALALEELGPRGRLLSAELEDQSGRIDLNRASLPLIARTLGLSTTLGAKLKADDKQIRLADGSFLQEQGFLWIDGEVTFYRHHDGGTVSDFTRPALVPGMWEPPEIGEPREFEAGEEVLDFRAWMVAAWLFKATPGREARFDTLTQPMSIAQFGRGALGPEQRARLERLGTIWTADGGRDRFGLKTRVFDAIVADKTRELRVEQAAFVGRGTLCRVTTYSGRVDYGFVVRTRTVDDGFRVVLEMPLAISADPYQAVAEFLLPRPVNVNACTPETLELLLTHLRLKGQVEVDEITAKRVAERIVAARPLAGMQALIGLLDTMVEKEKSLKDEQRRAILFDAEHSGSAWIEVGTAPFCFASDGVFDLRAAASLNFALNGREKSRAFLREIVATAGAGSSARAFASQRDFDEPWRITRLARDWTTLPENMEVGVSTRGAANPPSRLPAMLPFRSRFPSEQLDGVAARLGPAEMYVRTGPNDQTWHFDDAQNDDSVDPDGWRMANGPLTYHPDGQNPGVNVILQTTSFARPGPFGVSMWWNPGRTLGVTQTLLDWKANARAINPELQDRVLLRFVNNKLEFEVDDAFLRLAPNDRYSSKIVYDFTDGLPLEADTWYHVTAFCRGNRGSQMSLWVDGKPRGKWSHHTRLLSQFASSSTFGGSISVDDNRLADGTNPFPVPGALRVGTEVFEYATLKAGSITAKWDPDDHFGGIRPSPNPASKVGGSPAPPTTFGGLNHPAQSAAELYGYSARLSSDVPLGSVTLDPDGLGKFGIAMVDPAMAKTNISIAGNMGPISLGMGFESDVQEILVRQLDGNKFTGGDKTFCKNGGYALLMSYELRRVRANNSTTNDQADLAQVRTALNSICGGVEVIQYGGYDGQKLSNVRRGQALGQNSELKSTDFVEQNQTGTWPYTSPAPFYVDKHAYVQLLNPMIFGGYKPGMFVVLAIPISVRISGSNVLNNLLVPEVRAGTDWCELAQIDSNFNGTGKDSTEWVRYNSIVRDSNGGWHLLRSDPEAIAWMRFWIEGGLIANQQNSTNFNGNGGADALYQIADALKNNSASGWAPNGTEWKKLCDAANQEDYDNPANRGTRDLGSKLAFRGVLGTGDSEHSGSTKVYPVFRIEGGTGLPGRYDEITLVGSSGERPERHILNYAWPKPGCEDYPNEYPVALLAEEAKVRFVETPTPAINTGNTTGYAANVTWWSESRNFARMLKFPSGELPSVWDGSSTITVGEGGGDGAKVDEVRLFSAEDPQQLWPHGMYLLRRDISPSQTNRFELYQDVLRFPGQSIGQLPAPNPFQMDASVWQLGDDVIVCGERQNGSPITQEIADQGRTRFGGTPGHHDAGEAAMLLPWFCMTRLSDGLSESDSRVGLVEGANFPRTGVLLIDQELMAYTDKTSGDAGVHLYVPTWTKQGSGGSGPSNVGDSAGTAAFRARFGTIATSHAPDAIVFYFPWRYPDGYVERCDIPELSSFEVPIAARRALFHSLTWKEEQSDPLASLVASVRVQGRGDFAADVDDPDFFVFERPGTLEEPNRIDRQGDLLRVRFAVRYRAGAFDPVDFARNSWKRAPRLDLLGLEYLADRVVELHEESR